MTQVILTFEPNRSLDYIIRNLRTVHHTYYADCLEQGKAPDPNFLIELTSGWLAMVSLLIDVPYDSLLDRLFKARLGE